MAIAILVIITAVSWPGLQNYKLSQIQKSGTETVLSVINEARTLAQSGESARSYSVTIDTTNKTLTLFKVTTDPGDTAYSKTETLDSNIVLVTQITGSSDTITFDRFTGATSNTATVTVRVTKIDGTNYEKIVRIYKTGLAALD